MKTILLKNPIKKFLGVSLVLVCAVVFNGCGQGAIPGGGELSKAVPEGVPHAPNDEAPIVSTSNGMVRQAIPGFSSEDSTPRTPITYSGMSN